MRDKKARAFDHIEETEVVEPIVEEVEQPKKVEAPAVVKKSVDVDAFIARKLRVINEMPDGAKKRNAAERVLKNKEV